MKKPNLFFTVANFGYREFVLNFFNQWQKLEMGEFRVVCLDEKMFSFCKDHSIKAQLDHQNISESFHFWRTQQYRKIVFKKLDAKKRMIRENHDHYRYITYMDTDVWVLKNFLTELEHICSVNKFDILFQDGEREEEGESSHIDHNDKITPIRACNNFCTGFMVMNMIQWEKIVDFLSYKIEDMFEFVGNQPFLNKKIKSFSDLIAISLPKSTAPNTSNPHVQLSQESWFLHYTYLMGEEKKSLMKSKGHWIIPS